MQSFTRHLCNFNSTRLSIFHLKNELRMPNRRFSIYIPLIFILSDVVGLVVATLITQQRIGISIPFPNLLLYYLFSAFCWFALFFVHRLQEGARELNLLGHIRRYLVPQLVFVGISFAYALGLATGINLVIAATFTLSFFTLGLAWRIAWYYAIRVYRARGYNFRNVVILGENDVTRDLARHLTRKKTWGYKFLGYKEDMLTSDFRNFKDYIESNRIDVIFCYSPALAEGMLQEVINVAENNLVKVKLVSEMNLQGRSNISVDHYGPISTLNVTSLPLDKLANRFLKRSFDLLFSSLVIACILSWLLPVLAILIKSTSRGPVFFIQDRHGRDNRPFRIIKLRTMRVHDDKEVKQATKDDNRITPLGRFLRVTSLDELPQFFNVFMGDMSVVGPRPHAIKHNEEFKPKIDRFMQRHAVKPGITGLAQAKGFRGETKTFDDLNGRIKLDKFYVRNWSIFLDIQIIILTVVSLVKGSEKAY